MRAVALLPLLLVACTTTGDQAASEDAQVAELIAGRVAGPSVDCLQQSRIEGLRPIGERTIVARGGNRIWINRLPESCPSLRSDSVPVIRVFNAQYCRGDMFTSVPASTPNAIPGGSCRLGSFTPYEKR